MRDKRMSRWPLMNCWGAGRQHVRAVTAYDGDTTVGYAIMSHAMEDARLAQSLSAWLEKHLTKSQLPWTVRTTDYGGDG